MEVTRPPTVKGQDVWPVAPSNMWQAKHAAVMCRALQGQATALPRAPAAQSSGNRPAASLALLHSVSRAWCWVVVALEPHSSALHLYDCGEGTVITVCPADLEALHLGALGGDGGAALYLQGTVAGSAAMRFRRQSGGDALRLVMAPAPKAALKPPPKRSPLPQYGRYANIWYVLQHFGGDLATEQRRTKAINVCPWSRPDGAGHCTWKAGKHCRPAHLHLNDLLDHLQRDHVTDPAQRDQELAMLAGIMPGGQAGPFASAQARSRALTLPTSARPARGRGASQSAAQPGAIGSAAQRGATTATGSAAASVSGGEAAGGPAASAGSKPAAAASGGDPRGQGASHQPPGPGAAGPPASDDPDPASGSGPQAQP